MKKRWILRALPVLAMAGLLIAAARFLPFGAWFEISARWAAGAGVAGLGLFAILYALLAVLLVPGSILTLTAGAVFGLTRGLMAVSIGSTMGAAAAFLIGRHLARERVARWAAADPRFSALDAAVGRAGGRIVLLTRLSPIFPYNVLNYLLGLTGIGFWPYLFASWVGMLPGALLYVYLGFAGRAAAEAATASTLGRLGEVMFWGLGLAATALLTYLLTRLARRALAGTT